MIFSSLGYHFYLIFVKPFAEPHVCTYDFAGVGMMVVAAVDKAEAAMAPAKEGDIHEKVH